MVVISKRKVLVFDLEVVALDYETSYDEETKKYLIKYALGDPAKEKEAIEQLVFTPYTSRIVAIGMLDYHKDVGAVLVNTENLEYQFEADDSRVKVFCDSEEKLLEIFWEKVKKNGYNLFVTFNGREFDCPFIMLRSILLGIKPAYNLMAGTDFNFKDYHVDLMKEFTFFKHSPTGARRKFSLDFYFKMFGIKSPKEEGVAGDKVGELYGNKEYKTIADYCMRDVFATAKLFKIWSERMNF